MEYAQHLPLVIAIVEALKVFGVNGAWSAVAGILLGVGFSLGLDYVPEAMAHVIRAIEFALAVPGFYMLTKRAGTAIINGRNGAVTKAIES